MITAATPSDDGTTKNVRGPSSRKRAAIVIPAFVLTAFFIVTGAPAATAAQAYPGGSVTTVDDPPPPCRGNKPGICIPSSRLDSKDTTQVPAQEPQQQQQTP